MEAWKLALVIIFFIVVAVLTTAVICFCKREETRSESSRNFHSSYNASSDVESQRSTSWRNVESQRRTTDYTNTRSNYVNESSRPQLNVPEPSRFRSPNVQTHTSQLSKKNLHKKQSHLTQPSAVLHNTIHKEQFASEPNITLNTSTEYSKLDLHNYRKKAAMDNLKTFLMDSITDYMKSSHNSNKRFVLVITGKGLHSAGGVPVIKPAVEKYLQSHKYIYVWSNPGMAKVDLLPLRKLYESTMDDYDE